MKLRKLGSAAVPALEKAIESKDADIVARAKPILGVIRAMEKLTPELMREFPGIEERLAGDDAHAWTTAFLEAEARDMDEPDLRRHSSLTSKDLRGLVVRAAQGARDEFERMEICYAALWRNSLPRMH